MNKEQILTRIAENACDVIPELEEHNFQPTDQLKELGANSVDRVEIIMMTLEDLDLQIPLMDVSGATNIGELAEVLHGKL